MGMAAILWPEANMKSFVSPSRKSFIWNVGFNPPNGLSEKDKECGRRRRTRNPAYIKLTCEPST